MASLKIEDRYPLITQRGNFSGKASAFVKSIVVGDWWRSDPSTGDVPFTVERNSQFHINQGPVEMEIINAKTTFTPTSLPPDTLIGTFLPRRPNTIDYNPEKQTPASTWREYFIWHVGSKQSDLEFSTTPTKY